MGTESAERFAEWENTPVGEWVDLYGPDGLSCCEAAKGDFYCTRDEGHDGSHVATARSRVVARWSA